MRASASHERGLARMSAVHARAGSASRGAPAVRGQRAPPAGRSTAGAPYSGRGPRRCSRTPAIARRSARSPGVDRDQDHRGVRELVERHPGQGGNSRTKTRRVCAAPGAATTNEPHSSIGRRAERAQGVVLLREGAVRGQAEWPVGDSAAAPTARRRSGRRRRSSPGSGRTRASAGPRARGSSVARLDEPVVDDRQRLVDVLDPVARRRRRSPRRRRGPGAGLVADLVTCGASRVGGLCWKSPASWKG